MRTPGLIKRMELFDSVCSCLLVQDWTHFAVKMNGLTAIVNAAQVAAPAIASDKPT